MAASIGVRHADAALWGLFRPPKIKLGVSIAELVVKVGGGGLRAARGWRPCPNQSTTVFIHFLAPPPHSTPTLLDTPLHGGHDFQQRSGLKGESLIMGASSDVMLLAPGSASKYI